MTIDALNNRVHKLEHVCPHCDNGWKWDDYRETQFQCRFCCGTTIKDFTKRTIQDFTKRVSYQIGLNAYNKHHHRN